MGQCRDVEIASILGGLRRENDGALMDSRGDKMLVQGKYLVLATCAIALALAGGAWWRHYQESRRAAEFWGRDAGGLLVADDAAIALITLGEPAETDADNVAGRAVESSVEVTGKPGMVHLRHALTYDANFAWDEQSTEPLVGRTEWAHALEFQRRGQRALVLFTQDFARLGKLAPKGDEVAVLPCPRLGPVIVKYLGDVGVELPAATR